MPWKVVAFDCDGVMFDTRQANQAYYNAILRHFGKVDMTPEQFEYAHMHTVEASIAHLFGDEAEIAAAHAFRRTMGYYRFLDLMEIEPHLRSLLRWLRPAFKTAVATNRTDTMGRLLELFDLQDDFDLVVSASDVARPKPHPDSLIRVREHFGVAAAEVLYIGDSLLDEQAARAAGIPLAAYRNPALRASFHITRLNEVPAIVARQDTGG